MLLLDVNIVVYAFRADSPRHSEYKAWLEDRLAGQEPVGVSDLVLSGALRVLTHPRVFVPPTPLPDALHFIAALRSRSNCVIVNPGSRHWDIFSRLCTQGAAKGNMIADAYHAALAIEHGCEWITADRGFARFPGLRWRSPFE
ncbi:MAG: type II toxin-antitoxin system VapC family toxin [Gemmatimonadota bacterium]